MYLKCIYNGNCGFVEKLLDLVNDRILLEFWFDYLDGLNIYVFI